MKTCQNNIEVVIWLADEAGNILNRTVASVDRTCWENADENERERLLQDDFDELKEDFLNSLTPKFEVSL